MKILIIGSGGREHALAWKLAQSETVETVYVAPGNGGTAAERKCANVPLAAKDGVARQEELLRFARREAIDMTVVGPELPLTEGIVDRFRAAGLRIIGPDANAARLEGSKIFSKAFMEQYGVRTAKSAAFADAEKALAYMRKHFNPADGDGAPPLVIKADGLAAGKGVVIAASLAEAEAAIAAFMRDKSLGAAGDSVLLEEWLQGREVSVLAAVSVGPNNGIILPFVSARDHKRRFEGGRGPNTGGMGAIAPVPDFSGEARNDFVSSILEPTLRGMQAEHMDYRGFIFFGLMVQDGRCHLLEYNVRLGDPETQAVLPLMDCDLAGLCAAILDGSLADFPLKWKQGAVCAPVAVAEGYPGPYRQGDPIAIDAAALAQTGATVFIAGAESNAGTEGGDAAGGGRPASPLRSSGGRVLTVSAHGADADDAWARAYQGLAAISFAGMGYRTDIGREGAG